MANSWFLLRGSKGTVDMKNPGLSLIVISLLISSPTVHAHLLGSLSPQLARPHAPKLKIVVNQFYGEAKDVVLPIETVTSRMLTAAGFEIADSSFDLMINVSVTGQALSAAYSGVGQRYTGAQVDVEFAAESLGVAINQRKFENRIKPKDFLAFDRSISRDPSGAPFGAAFYGSGYFDTLAAFVRSRYGSEVYFQFWLGALDEELFTLARPWNPDFTNKVIGELGNLRDVRAVPPLIKAIGNPDAGAALVSIGEPAVDPLIQFLGSVRVRGYTDIRFANAAMALGEIGQKRGAEPLTRIYLRCKRKRSPTWSEKHQQLWSAGALFKLGDESKLDELLAELTKGGNRPEAIKVLRRLKEKRAFPPLLQIIKEDPTSIDAINATNALKEISGKDFGSYYPNWLKWWEENKDK